MRDAQHKLSKRHGDKSFEDLINEGYIVEAVVNYIVCLDGALRIIRRFSLWTSLSKS